MIDAANITSNFSLAPGLFSFDIGITFKPAFKGPRNIYMNSPSFFQDYFQSVGTWTASPASPDPPTADSVSPNSGAGTSQRFTFQSSDVNGAGYIQFNAVLFNTGVNGAGACYVFYYQAANLLYLIGDNGTPGASAWGWGRGARTRTASAR